MNTQQAKKKLEYLSGVVDILRKIRPQFKAQLLQTFLYIAQNEGCELDEIKEHTKLSQASVSRNVATLSTVETKGKPGLGFIKKDICLNDPKRYCLYLTTKGKQFLNLLLKEWTNEPCQL